MIFAEKTGVYFEDLHPKEPPCRFCRLTESTRTGFTTFAGAQSLINEKKLRVLASVDERPDSLTEVHDEEMGVDFVMRATRDSAFRRELR
jgi:hypothetical protein